MDQFTKKHADRATRLSKRAIDLTGADIREIVADVIEEFIEGMPKRQVDDSYLDRSGAAQFLNISLSKLDALCREGGLPFHMVGDSRRFDREEIRGWARKQDKENRE